MMFSSFPDRPPGRRARRAPRGMPGGGRRGGRSSRCPRARRRRARGRQGRAPLASGAAAGPLCRLGLGRARAGGAPRAFVVPGSSSSDRCPPAGRASPASAAPGRGPQATTARPAARTARASARAAPARSGSAAARTTLCARGGNRDCAPGRRTACVARAGLSRALRGEGDERGHRVGEVGRDRRADLHCLLLGSVDLCRVGDPQPSRSDWLQPM